MPQVGGLVAPGRAELVTPRAGQGTFVTGRVGAVPVAAYTRLSRGLRGWLRSAREAGLSGDQVRALIAAALDDEAQSGVA